MQDSINQMRYRTGGYLSGDLNSGVTFINPANSPYNNYVNINDVAAQLQALANALSGFGFGTFGKRATAERAAVSTTVSNIGSIYENSGIPLYTNAVGVPYPNALTTVFFFFLAFVGMFLVFHAIIWVIARAGGRSIWAQDLRRMFWLWMGGNALLMCLMWSFPVWIFSFFQFRIGDSGLAIFWGVFAIILTFIPLVTMFFLNILRSRRRSTTSPHISALYTSYNYFHSSGALYRAYKPKCHWFWMVWPLAIIARSGFIVFGPQNGWAQVIGNTVVELILFVLLISFRPHKDRKGDWLGPVLSFVRLCGWGLMIAFLPSIGVAAIPRTIIGFVIIVLFGIATILLLFGLLFNIGYGWIWKRHGDRIEDGFEVDRYIADDSSQKPAMTSYTPHDSRDSALNRRTSLIEPVGDNVYEPRTYRFSRQNEDPRAAYDEAARGGRLSNPPSRATSPGTFTGVGAGSFGRPPPSSATQYYTPQEDEAERRWSRDQYFSQR